MEVISGNQKIIQSKKRNNLEKKSISSKNVYEKKR